MLRGFLLAAIAVVTQVYQASGHGMMMDPVARSSAWRKGFPTPRNYDDNALFCGGFARQQSNGGRCGVCGDAWNGDVGNTRGERENEGGGRFATGVIVKEYKMGQVFTATSRVTANHNGYFEYRICPATNYKVPVTQECLDKHLLPLADGSGTKFMVDPGVVGLFKTDLKLPDGLVCDQCVIQWKYHAGNSWGVDPVTGRGCVGCGPQEEFYGCADVRIVADGTGPGPLPLITAPPPTQAPVTNPPVTNPPVTQAPVTDAPRTTQAPVATSHAVIGHGGTNVQCHGINNWANDPSLDVWCTDSCNKGNCPPLACDCTPRGAATQAPTQPPTTTTTRPTTTTTTTPKPTTTTTTTTPKPTTTTPTTTTARPTTARPTTQPTPKPTTQRPVTPAPTTRKAQPPAGNQQYHTHVTCKAINNWAGNEFLDRWCRDTCAHGNCPEESCRCDQVKVAVSPTPGTVAPVPVVTQYKQVCQAIGVWDGNSFFNTWCTQNCNTGYCPPAACTCVKTPIN